jgi:thioesterase domain-containing protein/non-ribosomal peptide synthetase component F
VTTRHPNLANVLALTPGQEGMFFHALYTPDSIAYRNQLSVRISGDLDNERLRAAWRATVRRHESLRGCFRWRALDRPVQVIVRELDPYWQEMDFTGRDDDLHRWLEEDRVQGFELDKPGLHRVTLVRTGPQEWLFVLSIHHLVIDGWSMGVIFADLFRAYREPGTELPPAAGFSAYARWVADQDPEATRKFWQAELAGFTEPTHMDVETDQDWRTGYADSETMLALTPSLVAGMDDWARRSRVTVSSVFYAAYALVLHRFSGQHEVLYGATMSGRPSDLPGVSEIVGNMVTVLPVRLRVTPDESLIDWVRSVHDRIATVGTVQHSSLVQAQRASDVPAGVQLFTSIVTVENYPIDRSLDGPVPGLRLSDPKAFDRTVYPLNVTLVPGDATRIRVTYDSRRFRPGDVERLGHDLLTVLAELVHRADREEPVSSLLGAVWPVAAEAAAGSAAEGFAERFAAAVRLTPEAVAVRGDGDPLTYAELGSAAASIAGGLRDRGLGPGSRVALLLEQGPARVSALAGVLCSGSAVVPLDPGHDDDRLDRLVTRAAPDLVLAEPGARCPAGALSCVTVGELSGDAPAEPPAATDLALVTFSGGADGESQVVVASHGELGAYLTWAADSCPAGSGSVVTGPASSLPQLTGVLNALAAGAPIDLSGDGSGHGLLTVSTGELEASLRAGTTADCLVVFGPDVSVEQLNAWREKNPGPIVCVYTAPGTALPSCAHRIPADADVPRRVPLGSPLPEVDLVVVDAAGNPVPDGATGELAVGAARLRTGDLVRRRREGDLVYRGHVDDQAWLDGFRLDLTALAEALVSGAGLADAVVVAVPELVAYVVPTDAEAGAPTAHLIAELMRPLLPSHALPSRVTAVESIERDEDGRPLYDRLPDPDGPVTDGPPIPPRDAVELRLAVIYQELLGLETIDVRRSFFELGGDSILAVRMMAHIKLAFNRDLPLAVLIEDGGTLESVAELLRAPAETDLPWNPVVPIRTTGSQRPSFWVHAAGGNVLSYSVIADHLGPAFPVYGLQARGLERGQEPLPDVETIAKTYVEAIREQQPTGPYVLAGWSFGGMAAVEMARQLEAAGEEVAELIMVDTGTRDAPPRTMDPRDPVFLSGMATFISNGAVAGFTPDELAAMPADDRVPYVVSLAKEAGSLPPGFEVDDLYRILAVYAGCNDAYRRYTPTSLPARTTLIRAEQNPDSDPQLGWSALTTGRLRVIDAPGNHVSVMDPANVARFAPQLAEVLREASAFVPGNPV